MVTCDKQVSYHNNLPTKSEIARPEPVIPTRTSTRLDPKVSHSLFIIPDLAGIEVVELTGTTPCKFHEAFELRL